MRISVRVSAWNPKGGSGRLLLADAFPGFFGEAH